MLLVDQELARRLERAVGWAGAECARIQQRAHPESGAMVAVIAGSEAVFAGPASPMSQVFGVGLAGPVDDAEIDRLEAFYKERGAPVQAEICSLADPSVLEIFGRRGYRLAEITHVLIRRLGQDGPSFTPPRIDPEIQIHIASPDESQAVTRLLVRCFADYADIPEEALEGMEAMLQVPGATHHVASIGGQQVGAGALIVCDGIGHLGGAGTLAEFRNRGVQTALLQARLAAAEAAGCDLAITSTRPGTVSQRNVERAGFRLAYFRAMMVRSWS